MTEIKKTVFFIFMIIHVLILLLCTDVISTWQRNDYGLSSESYISDIYYKSIGLKEEAFAEMNLPAHWIWNQAMRSLNCYDLWLKKGKTLIMVTHNPELAVQCDEQIRILDGSML